MVLKVLSYSSECLDGPGWFITHAHPTARKVWHSLPLSVDKIAIYCIGVTWARWGSALSDSWTPTPTVWVDSSKISFDLISYNSPKGHYDCVRSIHVYIRRTRDSHPYRRCEDWIWMTRNGVSEFLSKAEVHAFSALLSLWTCFWFFQHSFWSLEMLGEVKYQHLKERLGGVSLVDSGGMNTNGDAHGPLDQVASDIRVFPDRCVW